MTCFFKFIFILAIEIKKNHNRVFKKKTLFVIFGFVEWQTHPGLRYKHKKKQILHEKLFFRKDFHLSTKASLQPKKGLKIFTSNLCFCLWKKAYHTIFIYENYMIIFFLTKIKIMFLKVKFEKKRM